MRRRTRWGAIRTTNVQSSRLKSPCAAPRGRRNNWPCRQKPGFTSVSPGRSCVRTHGAGQCGLSTDGSRRIAAATSATKPGGKSVRRAVHQAAPPSLHNHRASGGAAPRANSSASNTPSRPRSQIWKVAQARSSSIASKRSCSASSSRSPVSPRFHTSATRICREREADRLPLLCGVVLLALELPCIEVQLLTDVEQRDHDADRF